MGDALLAYRRMISTLGLNLQPPIGTQLISTCVARRYGDLARRYGGLIVQHAIIPAAP